MAIDNTDCPCWGCTKRPDCYGCKEGNLWRLKKQAEKEQRYKNNAFQRYEFDARRRVMAAKANLSKKKNKRWGNQK
jgi:hypothetical protein